MLLMKSMSRASRSVADAQHLVRVFQHAFHLLAASLMSRGSDLAFLKRGRTTRRAFISF